MVDLNREMGTNVTKPVIEHATVNTGDGGVTVRMDLGNGKSLSGSLPSTATDDDVHTLVEALEAAAEQLA
jgi:hypothetical protein